MVRFQIFFPISDCLKRDERRGRNRFDNHIRSGMNLSLEVVGTPVCHQSHESTLGDLKEIVNQGKLVSDEIIINLLSKRLEIGESKGEVGFILDGFPRTIRQAEILEGVTDIDLVVNLKLREDVLLEKCLGRRICSQCGGNYNVAAIEIKSENGKPGVCMAPLLPPPHCASKLITRSDDTEEVVKERLRIYNETSQPVEEFYRSRGKLLEFDLPGGIPESWPKLLQALNLDDHDDKQTAAA
ncbi:probable adenylate kinase 6, chloroplastic isoform X2 [Aristolochia californica]|uniref:probable adenylate kinase 6, chloroplastic isoform X2 n=1 Tax=Aristolochia californica TaxID=171875 RepID=UPI0035DEA4E6